MSARRAKPRICCFTSFTFSYLPRARILAQTLRQVHPDWALHAVLADKPPPGLDAASALHEFDVVVDAETLRLPRFKAWLFKHDVIEASTAVKGQMLVELLEAGFDKIVYLDPDIALFHPLDTILERLDTASIVLTPHQCEPNDRPMAIMDNERTSMRYGVFNLGFAAVRNDETGRAFAAWWARELYSACYDAIGDGIFTDQKYCDLVPGLFARVHIERDPGCNVASWNLSRRKLWFKNGALMANDTPLKFYHFTKIGAAGDVMTDRYAEANTEVFEIWRWYKRELERNATPGLPAGYWRYGRFSDGKDISARTRAFYRSRADLMQAFDDPFEVSGNSFYQWLLREAPQVLEKPHESR